MRTHAERREALYKAASVARTRVIEVRRAFDELGMVVKTAHHLEHALRKIGLDDENPLEGVSAVCMALLELEKTVHAAGLEDRLGANLLDARKQIHQAANAFLVDTQPL